MEQQNCILAVSASGEVTGDYWEAISYFERRAETRRAEQREAEQKAEMEERRLRAEQAAREREQAEQKKNGIQAQIKRLTAGKAEPNKFASYAQKAEYWNQVIQEFKDQGMEDQEICKLLKIHIKVIYEATKLTPREVKVKPETAPKTKRV